MKLVDIRKIGAGVDNFSVNFSIGTRPDTGEYLILNDEGDYVMHAPTRLVEELDGLAELDVILDELAVQHCLALDTAFDNGRQAGIDATRLDVQRLIGVDQLGKQIAVAIENAADHVVARCGRSS